MLFFDKYKSRNSSIELLRIIAMFSILLIHTFGHGSNLDYNWIYSLGTDLRTAGHLILFSIGKAGVTIFIFISGYYGIRFDLKKFFSLIFILIFYSVFTNLLNGNSIKGILLNSLHPWDGWWFIQSYLIIYILSPVINAGIEKISENQFRFIIIFLLFYTYIGQFFTASNAHNTDFLFTVFIVGRYLKMYPLVLMKNAKYIFYISFVLLSLIPIIIINFTHSNQLMRLFLNNNNILLLIFSASTVVFLERKVFHSIFINYLASSTLSIYLITDSSIRRIIDPWLLNHVISNPIVGYIFMIVICLICLFIDKIREILSIPFSRILDNYICK